MIIRSFLSGFRKSLDFKMLLLPCDNLIISNQEHVCYQMILDTECIPPYFPSLNLLLSAVELGLLQPGLGPPVPESLGST